MCTVEFAPDPLTQVEGKGLHSAEISFHNVPTAQKDSIMSLNYDLTRIAVTDTVPFSKVDGSMNPTTNALIWCGMVVSLSGITAKNVDEWIIRTTVLHGLIQTTKFTRADITANIGLSTNCPDYTRKQWLAHMAKIQKNTLADAVRSVESVLRTGKSDTVSTMSQTAFQSAVIS